MGDLWGIFAPTARPCYEAIIADMGPVCLISGDIIGRYLGAE